MGVAASGGAARRRALTAAIVLLAAAGQASPARAAGVVSYVDHAYPSIAGAPTGSKPESKLWYAQGSWWAVMVDPASSTQHIFRLSRATEEWIDTGVAVDSRPGARADVLWDKDDDKLYVASHEFAEAGAPSPASPGAIWRFSYDKTAKTYRLDDGFPVPVNGATSETLVIDMDSLGRLWATWTQQNQVHVTHAVDSGNATWVAPYVVPTLDGGSTVNNDDISSLVAFGGDKIGVMWSNQRDGNMYFAVHHDAAGDDAAGWVTGAIPIDAPFAGGVRVFADDHINLKADGGGRVYAAVKHSTDDWLAPETPVTSLLVREVDGTWSRSTVSTTADRHTRSIVQLDSERRVIHVFETGPTPPARSGFGGGTIYEKRSPMDTITFPAGHGDPVIGGAGSAIVMNDVTSTKQRLTSKTGLVVLASDTRGARYWHADQTLGGRFTLPPARVPPPPEREGTPVEPPPPDTPPAPPAPPAPPPAPTQVVLKPVADGAASARRPRSRLGRETALRARGGRHAYRSYLKFHVSGVAGRITAARLRLHALAPDRGGATLFLASNRWNERSLSWRRAPRALDAPRLAVPRARGRVVEVDVRRIVSRNGTYTLALAGARGAGARYSSREAGVPAALVLTVG